MLNLHNITKIYGPSTQEIHALNDVTISFVPSEFFAILGPFGCGKTTPLNIIGDVDIISAVLIVFVSITCLVCSIMMPSWVNAFMVIGISVLVTLIAGYIPTRIAAKGIHRSTAL